MTAGTLVSSVLPDSASEGLAYAEVYSDPPGLTPLPEEEPLIAKSVAKRRNEFITVRHCARIALGELGVGPVPILKGDKGEPCWPDGVVGSLTHCEGYRGAVVGRSARCGRSGSTPNRTTCCRRVCSTRSRSTRNAMRWPRCPAGLHWDRILFCAKEATYKAWFPLTQRWLGFEDAHITFDVDTADSGRRFVSKILIDPDAHGPPLTRCPAVGRSTDGLVLTAIVL